LAASERRDRFDESTWRLLQLGARLMLEYNERSDVIKRHLDRVAKYLNVAVTTVVGYREVTLATPDGRVYRAEAPELRINVAVSVGTLRVLDELCTGRIGIDETTRRLESMERTAPRHGRWLVAAIFGLAATALAELLRADWSAAATSGVAAALGLIVRQELPKQTGMLLAAPFTAGVIGALLGGLVIRLNWTLTPNECLIVPALMLVPGPHLINSIEDILENQIQTGICRLCLAAAILFAAALGVVVGAWLTLGTIAEAVSGSDRSAMTLPLSVALAGVASCGFGAFYNSPWRVMWVSVVCGMVGHGVRAVSLASGAGLAIASLFACLTIGLIARVASDRMRLPFASVAFAGAVPMMPGTLIYQSIAGALRISAAGISANPELAIATLSPFLRAGFVVAAMTIGLVTGARITGLLRLADEKAAGY
jgi:uncharacterized membrane protein YjjP (DUF1212 family)